LLKNKAGAYGAEVTESISKLAVRARLSSSPIIRDRPGMPVGHVPRRCKPSEAFMKNIVIAIILGISFIICAAILGTTKDRYKVVMNEGQTGGLVTLKYDTVSGEAWRLVLPENYWAKIPDPGRVYIVPELNEKNK
jgi:hypothetical protein